MHTSTANIASAALLLFSSTWLQVHAAPNPSPPSSVHQDGHTLLSRADDWPKCATTGPGTCTIYIASSDGTGDRANLWTNYRTAVLFDNECEPSQGIRTDLANRKITLKGHLPAYVDIWLLDDFYRPSGYISYLGRDTVFGDHWGGMACQKFEGTDGVACRIAFDCS